jgi:hypothetical protein
LKQLEEKTLEHIKANDIPDHPKYLEENKEKIAQLTKKMEESKKSTSKKVHDQFVLPGGHYDTTLKQVKKNNKYTDEDLEKVINFDKD